MLVLGIFSLMMAVGLPTVIISPPFTIRVTSVVSLCVAALSFNASNIQAIGSYVGGYSGLFQVTAITQVIDCFIYTFVALAVLSTILCLLVKLHNFNYFAGSTIVTLVLTTNLLFMLETDLFNVINITVALAWFYSSMLGVNHLCTMDFSPRLIKPDPTGERARFIKQAQNRSFMASLFYPTVFSLLALAPVSPALNSVSSTSANNTSLEDLRQELKSRMENFKLPEDFDHDTFKKVLNGFFQAEGHISCKVRPTVFVPVLSFNQLHNELSMEFFLTAWHVLGQKGSLYITETIHGKFVINYFAGSWQHILDLRDFFNLCYGEKYIAFAKLAMIHDLMKQKTTESTALAVTLSYSLAVTGAVRPKELSGVLSDMGLASHTGVLPEFSGNTRPVSAPFLIGFILGDGSLYVRLKARGSGIRVIPGVFLPQLNTEYNLEFLTHVQSYLLSCGIKSNISYFENMIRLEILAFSNVCEGFVPLVAPYAKYFYWKSHQYVTLALVSKLVVAKEHYVPYGMKIIIDTLYQLPDNNRRYPIEHWYSKLDISAAMSPSPQDKSRIDAILK